MVNQLTRTIAMTTDQLNRASVKVLRGRIATNRECVELWRRQAEELESLIREGDRKQRWTAWLQSTRIICDVTFDVLAMALPEGQLVKGTIVGMTNDAASFVLDSIRDGLSGGVKSWTTAALKTTTAGALDEAARQGRSAMTPRTAQGLKLGASGVAAVFTVWKGVEGIKEAAETAIAYEEVGVELKLRLVEIRRVIRDLEAGYRSLCDQLDRGLKEAGRIAGTA
jgi:hypothetical protein